MSEQQAERNSENKEKVLGSFPARVKPNSLQLQKVGKNLSPGIVVELTVNVKNEFKQIQDVLYLTDGAMKRSVEHLAIMGHTDQSLEDLVKTQGACLTKEFDVLVKEEEGTDGKVRLKIGKYYEKGTGPTGAMKMENVDKADVVALGAAFNSLLGAKKAEGSVAPKTASKSTDDIPF